MSMPKAEFGWSYYGDFLNIEFYPSLNIAVGFFNMDFMYGYVCRPLSIGFISPFGMPIQEVSLLKEANIFDILVLIVGVICAFVGVYLIVGLLMEGEG